MTLTRFSRGAAFALYLLSSGGLFAANQSDDLPVIRSKTGPVQHAFLIADEDVPAQRAFLISLEDSQKEKSSSKAAPLSEEDLLIAELMRKRDQALKKAQEAEAKVSKQTQLLELMKQRDEALKKAKAAEATADDLAKKMEEMKARSNPPVTPQPSPQASPVSPNQASASASPQGPQATPVAPQPVKAPATSSSASAASSVPRPFDIAIPDIARGYEDIYRRFLGGKLIYTDPTSKAKRELPIRALANPLEGTFDLSGCGDTGQYLSISTGYRKGLKAENARKVVIWLAPRFLVEKNISSTAKHLQPIMGGWNSDAAPVGIFWTWGGREDLDDYDYLVTNSFEVLGSEDLYEKWKKSGTEGSGTENGLGELSESLECEERRPTRSVTFKFHF